MFGWLLDEAPSDFVYWIVHASQPELIGVCIILGIVFILIINPRVFMSGKSYKRHQTFRNCIECGRRCRKGKKGKFCSTRCERKHYTKAARQNYTGRKWIRNRLLESSNICGICLQPILKPRDATIDHIIPLSKGGKDVIENMQLAHADCNYLKGDTEPPGTIIEPDGGMVYG